MDINSHTPSINKNFDGIKNTNEEDIEYWTARDLMSVLEYVRWENFEEVIKKAIQSCINSGQNVENHFRKVTKMTIVGSNTVRSISDWNLDRYACYLIAQNGDSSKKAISIAQTYFAVQTRRQEILDTMGDSQKRVFIRGQVTTQNKKLFSAAKKAGVTRFGYFNDAGYRGLYGKSLSEIEQYKKINKGELLDRAGATELAANLFRITQTEEKLTKENISGESKAITTHFTVGNKVRQTIKEIGGILPENLIPEKNIKSLKKDINQVKLQEKIKLKSKN